MLREAQAAAPRAATVATEEALTLMLPVLLANRPQSPPSPPAEMEAPPLVAHLGVTAALPPFLAAALGPEVLASPKHAAPAPRRARRLGGKAGANILARPRAAAQSLSA